MSLSKTQCSSILIALFSVFLSACGGGGGGAVASNIAPPVTPTPFPPDTSYQPNVYQASSEFKDACEAPRTGAGFDDFQGSELTEKHWLRSWSNETYLWYDEITDIDPHNGDDKFEYFDLLKTFAVTPSGADRDQFHDFLSTEEYEQFVQSGISFGYGAHLLFGSLEPPRELHVAFVEPGSSAEAAGLIRGMRIMEVDDENLVSGSNIGTLNAGLFPETSGEVHTFGVLASSAMDTGTYPQLDVTAGNVTSSPVLTSDVIATGSGNVGYIVFNDHIATAEAALVNAITDLEAASVTDLILDLRYNGGGLLAIASQLAYMIAGDANTTGRTFELLQFNDQHPTVNPVTINTITPTPFIDETIGFSLTAGSDLPTLDLNRVYIITGSETCSASESIINSLNGIAVEIILIGDTTCGKPYGFYPQDNCGTTYFTIQFQGVNDIDFGDYADGFTQVNSGEGGVTIPGCAVMDDLSKELGDVSEGRLAAALAYRAAPGTCPVPPPPSGWFTTLTVPADQLQLQSNSQKSFVQSNRILGLPQ